MDSDLKFDPNVSNNSSAIAHLMMDVIVGLSPAQQELLFQTKKEQTFSSLLSQGMQSKMDSNQLRALVELKGFDYLAKDSSTSKSTKNRNTHDLGVLDSSAKLIFILENKVWYHFDGAKGSKVAKVEKNVREQLKGDIFKLQHTAKHQEINNSYILITVVTPSRPENLPKSYRHAHEAVMKRTRGDFNRYRKEGVFGFISAIEQFQSELGSVTHLDFNEKIGLDGCGFLDVFCAEVLRKKK
jgi:hypothetical protein